MGCGKSQVAGPALLTSKANIPDAFVPDKAESRSLKQYVADVSSATDADLLAALQGLSPVEQRQLLDILHSIGAAAGEDGAPADVPSSSTEVLKQYIAAAKAADENEVTAAVQGLAIAERQKMVDALETLSVIDIIEPEVPAPGVGIAPQADGVDGLVELGASPSELAVNATDIESDRHILEGVVVETSIPLPTLETANSPPAHWMTCCAPQAQGTPEFVV